MQCVRLGLSVGGVPVAVEWTDGVRCKAQAFAPRRLHLHMSACEKSTAVMAVPAKFVRDSAVRWKLHSSRVEFNSEAPRNVLPCKSHATMSACAKYVAEKSAPAMQTFSHITPSSRRCEKEA